MAYTIIIVIAIVACLFCYYVGFSNGSEQEKEKAKINEVHRRIAEQQKAMLRDAEESRKQRIDEPQPEPTPIAPPPDDEDEEEVRTPINLAKEAGFLCEYIPETDQHLYRTDSHNFVHDEEVSKDPYCAVCGRTDTHAIWGTPNTHEQGLIGFFCGACGSGYLNVYPDKDGRASGRSTTLYQFLEERKKTT